MMPPSCKSHQYQMSYFEGNDFDMERIKLQSLYSTLLDSGASVSLKVTLESLVTHRKGNISLLDYISAPLKNVNKYRLGLLQCLQCSN